MLEQLTFDLMIDNPYRHLFELLGQLDIVHNKHLRQAAWAFCNDACLTALPLIIEARDVAIASLFFASVHTNQPIDDVEREPWWKYLKGDEDRCAKAIEVIRQFYTENPLRKQNPSLPSPAFELDLSRRRGDTQASQPETSPSNAPTPMELDRRSRSPRTNGGGGERDEEMNDRSTDPSSQGRPVDDSFAPRSPTKRKEAELDTTNTEWDRAEKRAKHSEDEEGELVEDI